MRKIFRNTALLFTLICVLLISGSFTVYAATSSTVTDNVNIKVVTKLKAVSQSDGKIKLSWKKAKGAAGYQVYRAESKNGKYTLLKSVSGNTTVTYTDSSSKKNSTYYYKVRGYKKVKKITYVGDYSAIVSCKSFVAVSKISIASSKSLAVGDSFKLSVVFTPADPSNKTITWTSSDKSVATVSNGTVKAVAYGQCIITAKSDNGKTSSCTLNVGYQECNSFDSFAKAASQMVKSDKRTGFSANSVDDPYYSRRLIVKSNGSKLDFSKLSPVSVISGLDNIYFVQFSSSSKTKKAMKTIQKWTSVSYVEVDSYTNTETVSSTASVAKSWGVEKTAANKLAAKVKSKTSSTIKVAVVDSGVSNHTFLKGRLTTDGYDFVDGDYNPADLNSHGTHVAGIIVDCTPDINVKIMPVRVLDSEGNGSNINVGNGIKYAANKGAKVINLSLGGGQSKYLDDCISYAVKKGVTVVVASGNDNEDIEKAKYCCPAHLSNVICVGAIDSQNTRAKFSNYGKSVDVVAPGVNIVSCIPGGKYASNDGTSMDAPHVAALAAMLKLLNPTYSPAAIEKLIKGNCIDLGTKGYDIYYGYGLPNFSNYCAIAPTGVSLNKTSATIETGSKLTLTATVSPSNATDKTVTWTSSNTSIATVCSGVVTAKAVGSAKITAKTANGKTATCTITVKAATIDVTSVNISKSSMTLEAGSAATLTATILPSNATNKTVTWTSSNTSVATVSNGVVSAKASGTTTITAKSNNGKVSSCKVTVIVSVISVNISKTSLVLEIGEVSPLSATVLPANATNKDVTWTSSKTAVATVSGGVVTAKTLGTTTVTVKSNNGKQSTCSVQVIAPRTAYVTDNGSTTVARNSLYYIDANNYTYYIKLKLGDYTFAGATMRIAIDQNGTVTNKTMTLSSDSVLKLAGDYKLFPINWAIKGVYGQYTLYYEIVLADGTVVHPLSLDTNDKFILGGCEVPDDVSTDKKTTPGDDDTDADAD